MPKAVPKGKVSKFRIARTIERMQAQDINLSSPIPTMKFGMDKSSRKPSKTIETIEVAKIAVRSPEIYSFPTAFTIKQDVPMSPNIPKTIHG